jgi:hypothetical protein
MIDEFISNFSHIVLYSMCGMCGMCGMCYIYKIVRKVSRRINICSFFNKIFYH